MLGVGMLSIPYALKEVSQLFSCIHQKTKVWKVPPEVLNAPDMICRVGGQH